MAEPEDATRKTSPPAPSVVERGEPMADGQRRANEGTRPTDAQEAEPPMLSKEEAIAEVKRWIERHKIDPSQIFARTGEVVVRYGDLIPHLEQETDEGRVLLRAISRGQVIRKERSFPGGEGGPRQ